jgi:hypothetical protein
VVVAVGAALMISATVITATAGTYSTQFISGPNTFRFVTTSYVVTVTPTNFPIMVYFSRGYPGASGSIGYGTTDGTAITGRDYTAVSGGLAFNGMEAYKSFSVPIMRASSPQDRTLGVSLGGTGPDHSATITIKGSPEPPLSIYFRTNRTVLLSWPGAYSNYIAEVTYTFNAPTVWTELSAPTVSNRQFVVNFFSHQRNVFFRLRRVQ